MADLRIGSDWVAGLERYIEGLAVTTELASSRAADYLKEQTILQARQSERAGPTWPTPSRYGARTASLVIGVRDEAYASQAWQIEYGDEVTPTRPSLPHHAGPTAEGMGKIMSQTFAAFCGPS